MKTRPVASLSQCLYYVFLFLLVSLSEHKVVFLKGDDSCSGTVGIEHGDHTYWLSGSNGTWDQDTANAVCQQKHCGKASAFSASVLDNDTKIDVWDKSYNCSSDTKSLFECDTQTQSSDHNDTIATVNCSGNIRQCQNIQLNCKLIPHSS